MPDRISKLHRWLDLIAALAVRRFPVTFEELRREVPAYALDDGADERERERVRRMFERDKDELRRAGIPIETEEWRRDGEEVHAYRIRRKDFFLPYLKLVREAAEEAGARASAPPGAFEVTLREADAALVGLREVARLPEFPLADHARAAFRKLAFDLGEVGEGDDPVVFVHDAEAAATRETLEALAGAVLERRPVRFTYRAMHRDAAGERAVRPYGLLFQHGRWYLVGHDEGRDDVRMFRLGRIAEVQVAGGARAQGAFEPPDDFRLDAFLGRSAWELGEDDDPPTDTTVRFRFPRSLWAERNELGALREELPDGSQRRSFRVHRTDPFLRWVLSQAPDAVVEEPEELRRAFRAMVQEARALHGDTGAHRQEGTP